VRGTGEALKRKLGVWAGVVVENPAMCASAHALVHGEREEGRTDKTGPRRRERKGGRVGATARHWRTRLARQRERERVNGRRKLAPTGRLH
jgi:hypothetical protein